VYAINQYDLPGLTTRNPITGALENYTQGAMTKTGLSGNSFGTTTAGQYVAYTLTTVDEGGASAGTYSTKMSASTSGAIRHAYSASQIITLNGDFSFLDDDSNGCTSADLTAGAGQFSSTGGTASINSACSVITLTSTSSSGEFHGGTGTNSRDKAVKFGFKLNGISDDSSSATAVSVNSKTGRALTAQTFTGSVVWQSTDASGNVTTLRSIALSPGSWTSTVATTGSMNIPYLPYGTGISRIVYFTNKAATAGTATISASNEAGTACSSTNFSTVSIPASGVALLTAAIDSGIAACFGASYTGKAQVNISVTGTASGDLTSNYNVGGDRVNVINSTNK